MEPDQGGYGERCVWVSAVGGGRGFPGESLIGTRECGSYAGDGTFPIRFGYISYRIRIVLYLNVF